MGPSEGDPSSPGMALHPRIQELFRLGEPIHCRAAGGTRNHSLVLETTDGRWLVRQRYAGYAQPERVRFDHAVLAFLGSDGVPVPILRKCSTGETWWHDGQEVWEVFSFVEGNHLRDGNAADTVALAVALARYHRVGRNFTGRLEKGASRGETDPAHLLQVAQQIRSSAPDTTKVLSIYESMIREAGPKLDPSSFEALPHTLIHGDVQPSNILIRDGRVAAFVDFDWCAWRPRLYDLGFAIGIGCARHDTPIGNGDIWALTQSPRWDLPIVRQFLRTYGKEDFPLSAIERKMLVPQLILTWCHSRLHGALKVPANQRRVFLEREPEAGKNLFHELKE